VINEKEVKQWAKDNASSNSLVAGYRKIIDRFDNITRREAQKLADEARKELINHTSKTVSNEKILTAAKWALENPNPNSGVSWAGANTIRKAFVDLSAKEADEASYIARKFSEIKPPSNSGEDVDSEDPHIRGQLIAKLKKEEMTILDISEFLNCSENKVKNIIHILQSSGWGVKESGGRFKITGIYENTLPVIHDTTRTHVGRSFKIGVVSDTHLASKYERLDVLTAAYDLFEKEGISTVYHCGNLIDGYKERINANDVKCRNVTDQAYYCASYYPQKEGITTYFISGACHEGWYSKAIGLNVGEYIQMIAKREGREDLIYLSHMEADIPFYPTQKGKTKRSILRLVHPGGGSSYAQSYQPQKTVESYTGGEKPNILLFGHYHKWGTFYPREVHCVLIPACVDQTPFMRSRRLSSVLGFVTIEFMLDNDGGISKFNPTYYPFYDRGYHIDRDEWSPSVLEDFMQ